MGYRLDLTPQQQTYLRRHKAKFENLSELLKTLLAEHIQNEMSLVEQFPMGDGTTPPKSMLLNDVLYILNDTIPTSPTIFEVHNRVIYTLKTGMFGEYLSYAKICMVGNNKMETSGFIGFLEWLGITITLDESQTIITNYKVAK